MKDIGLVLCSLIGFFTHLESARLLSQVNLTLTAVQMIIHIPTALNDSEVTQLTKHSCEWGKDKLKQVGSLYKTERFLCWKEL